MLPNAVFEETGVPDMFDDENSPSYVRMPTARPQKVLLSQAVPCLKVR